MATGCPVLDSEFVTRQNGKKLPCDELAWKNAKLRELVRDYERCTMHADCSMCEYDGKLSTHCPFSPCFPDTDELRELGIEVGEWANASTLST